ncbi:MAG: Ig-like domain-containing protein [Pyrinomonadaceae bacterium]
MLPPAGRRLPAPARFRFVALLLAFAIIFAALPKQFAPIIPSAHAASADIVISQVYGGGGNSGATFKNDFIELFNRGASPVAVTGWSVQYTSAGGSSWAATPLSGTIQPGHYYLVQEAAGANAAATNLPTPEATGTIAMSATAAKVALVTNTTLLSCGATNNCSSVASIKDFIGYGNTTGSIATAFEGAAAATLSNTTSAIRAGAGCIDSDNNSSDFTPGTPNPRNSASPTHSCTDSSPTITAPANPIATVNQDAVPFNVSLSGNDDGGIYNWSATPGTGVSTVSIASGQGTANVTYIVTLQAGFSGPAKFTAALSDNVNAPATQIVNINVTPVVTANNPPTINAPANPAATATQDSAPFGVSLTGNDDGGVYDWNATAGTGISSAVVTGGQGTPNVTYTVTLSSGFSGTATFTASLSDGVNAPVTRTVNINVTPAPASHVVISQVYGGGGNSGAPWTNDYVELYNPTASAVTLTGWSLQYASAAGTSWTNKQPLGGNIGAGEYYLVQLASGANGQPLPVSPNIAGDINMSGTTGKIALVSNGDSLSGGCPVGVDPDIVDFVGYGTGATCREGGASTSANAPAPSNTTALFRINGGGTDTNSNSQDFVAGTPAPRRTAPIVELGPWVASTDPTTNGFTIPHDATITVNFSEPVDVDAAWYNITCASGSHNDATVAHTSDFKTYAITPNTNFQFGEQCSVTILKDAIHDQDTDDSAPGTDTPSDDYVWSFTVVAAGQPAPYTPDVHLTMGNPSCGTQDGCATADTNHPNNYLMMKPTYALSYNRDKGTPNWVSWHLDNSWYGTLSRVDTFRADPAVPADWYRVQATDFFLTGFDRGHMTPNADRDNQNRVPINQETYLMSNMVPQAPDNNQGPWANMENYLRSLTDAGNELYIVSGPAGVGGTGSNGGTTTTIADGHVTVPASTWKVVLVLPKQDGDDVSRVTAATRTIAVIMPNVQGIRNDDWTKYIVSVDQVEALSHYDFFSNLPDAIENSIEAGTNGVNPPGTASQSVTVAEDGNTNIALDAVSSNPNATFTYTVSQPAHGTLTGAGASRTYTPAPDFNGTDSFAFSVNDGQANSNTSTVTITVTEVNDAPVALDDSKSTQEDTPLTFFAGELLANDTNGAADETTQTLAVTGVSAGAGTHGAVSLTDGQITYTPEADYHGAASFTYQVCDDGTTARARDPRCATGTVNVTISSVNDAPIALDDSATTNEDTPVNISVLGNDSDADNDGLTVTAFAQGTHGSVTNNNGVLTYAPEANYHGADSFTYAVSDGNGGSATANVTVTISSVNGAPVASGTSATTDEDNEVAIPLAASDVEGDSLTFSVASAPAHGSLSINGNVATYTPARDYNGADSFTFKANDAQSDSNAASVSIRINPVNDAPVAVADSATTDEDTPVTIALRANDTDVDGDALTVTGASGALKGTVEILGDGSVRYTPNLNANGSDSFTYAISDGHGGTATGGVTVTVNAVNDAPTVEGQSAETNEDTAKAVALAGSDPDGDSLTYIVVAPPAHGTASVSGANVTYTPNANYNGTDSFTFKANDGALDSGVATASVTVNAVNDAPSGSAQGIVTDEDAPKAITLTGTDFETSASGLTFNVTVQPSHGHLTGSAPNLSYVSDANYNGADSFSFTVTDTGDGSSPATTSAPATVSITINPVNDAPTLGGVPASAAINELAAYGFTASAGDIDAPAQTLTFSLLGAPAGAAIDPATGVFSWTPSEAQGGTNVPFAFKVRVSDGVVNTDADIVLVANEVNQNPTLDQIGSKTVNLGDTLSFNASGHDGDLPVQSLSYSLTGAVPSGATINGATGAFSWTPTAAQAGRVYTFGVRVTDNGSPALYAEELISVGAAYTWSGVSTPINADGSSVFNAGRTVPVKFSLTGASAGVTNATIRLRLFQLVGGMPGAELPVNAGSSDGNLFRFADGQYHLNWNTSGLPAGSYQLRIDAGDGVLRAVNVTIG